MPTATVRYGRPKGTGLDDRQQLETLAALLAANPKLKPTTAIRSLGVDDPSVIRRLREKFRVEQSTLMANARRATHPRSRPTLPITCNENTPVPERAQSRALVPVAPTTNAIRPMPASCALLTGWCDLAFSLMCTAADAQAALTQHWLSQPLVADAMRRQLALGSFAVSITARSKSRRRPLH
jgi:hypothetical protein